MGSPHRVRCDFYLHDNNPVHKLIVDTFGETFKVDENSSKAHAKRDVILNALWFTALSMKGGSVVAHESKVEPLTSVSQTVIEEEEPDEPRIPDDIMRKLSF